jgi:hypothetical protein
MSGGTSSGTQFANDGSFNTSTNEWTCPETGYYQISCSVGCNTNIGADFSWSFGLSQGSNQPYDSYLGYQQYWVYDQSTAAVSFGSLSVLAFISSGTIIYVEGYQNSGITMSFYGMFFSAALITA